MQRTSVRRLSTNRARADDIPEIQRRASLRVARWRERAEAYRTSAEACTSPGSQLAYRALAECADGVADRMQALQAKRGGGPAD
jgi:hypothetical protein